MTGVLQRGNKDTNIQREDYVKTQKKIVISKPRGKAFRRNQLCPQFDLELDSRTIRK